MTSTAPQQPQYYTASAAAKILKLDVSRVCQLCKEGRLGQQMPRIGNAWVITAAELEDFKLVKRPVGRPRKHPKPQPASDVPAMRCYFDRVGRDKMSFSIQVPREEQESPWKWMARVLRTRAYVMSRDVDFETDEDSEFRGTVTVGGFRAIGRFRLELEPTIPATETGTTPPPASSPIDQLGHPSEPLTPDAPLPSDTIPL